MPKESAAKLVEESSLDDSLHLDPAPQGQGRFKVNYGYLMLYVATLGINGICVTWTTCGSNQTANLFAAKLGWTDEETMVRFSAINMASQVGKTLGAIYAGCLIVDGRKHVFIRYNILAMLSSLLMQYLSFSTLFLGKFFNGISVTIVNIAALKMINETVPLEYMGSFGGAYTMFGSLGCTILSALGGLLP